MISNTCTFFKISDTLELLSELDNDDKLSQGSTIFYLLHGIIQVSEWNFDPASLQIMGMSSKRTSVNLRVTLVNSLTIVGYLLEVFISDGYLAWSVFSLLLGQALET